VFPLVLYRVSGHAIVTMLRAGRSRVPYPMRLIFSSHLILLAAQRSGVYTASNRNEYQKQQKMFLWSKVRPVRKVDNLTANYEPIV
jgi:hypothetical protein